MSFESRRVLVGVTEPITGEEASGDEGMGLLFTRFCAGEVVGVDAAGVEQEEISILALSLPVPTQIVSKSTRILDYGRIYMV